MLCNPRSTGELRHPVDRHPPLGQHHDDRRIVVFHKRIPHVRQKFSVSSLIYEFTINFMIIQSFISFLQSQRRTLESELRAGSTQRSVAGSPRGAGTRSVSQGAQSVERRIERNGRAVRARRRETLSGTSGARYWHVFGVSPTPGQPNIRPDIESRKQTIIDEKHTKSLPTLVLAR